MTDNTPVYLHDWAEGGFVEMVGDFENICLTKTEFETSESPWPNASFWREAKAKMTAALSSERWQDLEVLLASYSYENYSGDAFVLFRKNGQLFEVHGGHCSCYGLEGQWEPEETTIESLEHRLSEGNLGDDYTGNVFAAELRQVLTELRLSALLS